MEAEGFVYVEGDRTSGAQQNAKQQDVRQRDARLLQPLDALLLLAVAVAQEGEGVALGFELTFDCPQAIS